MKITLKPAPGESGDTFVLARETPARGPGSMVATTKQRDFQVSIQPAEFPDAETIDVFARRNLRTAFAFTVHATFNTYSECDQFIDDLGARLGAKGILELSYIGGGQRSLLGALTSISAVSEGVSAIINYTFLGGAFDKGPASNQASS